jgi:hypothetical protein
MIMPKAATQTTYVSTVRSFDHSRFATLPSYHKLREALSDFANEADALPDGILLTDLLAAMRDAALTAPYADCCDKCRHRAWPHAVSRDGSGWLTCTYCCPSCSGVWTCGYAVNIAEVS